MGDEEEELNETIHRATIRDEVWEHFKEDQQVYLATVDGEQPRVRPIKPPSESKILDSHRYHECQDTTVKEEPKD